MSHIRAALTAAGLPVDPTDDPHYQRFWYVPPHAEFIIPQRRRFTTDQVREIRRRARNGERKTEIAKLYGVAPWTIYRVTNGHTYTHVTEQEAA